MRERERERKREREKERQRQRQRQRQTDRECMQHTLTSRPRQSDGQKDRLLNSETKVRTVSENQ